MSWKESTVEEEKRRFLEAALAGNLVAGERVSFTTLCTYFQIAPKTGYKYLQRYAAEGEAGLAERSRAPHTVHRVASEVIEKIHAVRAEYGYGPLKLRQHLLIEYPDQVWPAASTIARYLQAAGETVPPAPPRIHLPGVPLTAAVLPNDVWATDFKGWCLTDDGTPCHPWTLTDLASRALLGCVGLRPPRSALVRAGFDTAFRQYGLPAVIRTDNGVPFVTSERLRLSRLTLWWEKLGIRHERIRVGCPQQNGRHERMHRTLKAATMVPPAATLEAQQGLFDQFRTFYNEVRPHAALGGARPATVYTPSPRPYVPELAEREFTYPAAWQVRRVRNTGYVKWQGALVFVSEVLIGEWVAFQALDPRYWALYVGTLAVAVWDTRRGQFLPSRQATVLLREASDGMVGDDDEGKATAQKGMQIVTDVVG